MLQTICKCCIHTCCNLYYATLLHFIIFSLDLMTISRQSTCNCSTTVIVCCTAILSIILGFTICYLCTKERCNYVILIIYRLIGRKSESNVIKSHSSSVRSKDASLTRNASHDNPNPLTTFLQINSNNS